MRYGECSKCGAIITAGTKCLDCERMAMDAADAKFDEERDDEPVGIEYGDADPGYDDHDDEDPEDREERARSMGFFGEDDE